MNKLICLVIVSLSLLSCATIVRPSGGEKDTTPPSLVMAKPISESINFQKSSFELKFDEFITSEDFASKILVSPGIETLNSKYTGKGIKLNWSEDLLPNTTYNFQFLNTIKDYNENNVLAGYQYTFSTGNELDTLLINGVIRNSTFEEVENVRVCLVNQKDFTDSTISLSQYNYATFAKKSGEFVFNYLPEGEFRLYAYSDKNKNDLWDEEEDFIGYHPDVILSSDSLQYQIELFKEDIDSKFIKAKHSGYNRIELIYQKAIPKIDNIKLLTSTTSYSKEIWVMDKVVNIFFDENIEDDSLTVLVNNRDTLPFFKTKYRKVELEVLSNFENIISSEPALFVSNYPLSKLDTSKIRTFIGLDSLISSEVLLQIDKQNIQIDFPKLDQKLNIVFQDSALVYSDSIYNSEMTFLVERKIEEDLAIIQCSFKAHNYPLIVELFTTDNKLISSKYLQEDENKIDFNRLEAGDYKLRFIVDENRDKLFTSGSVKKNTQPEVIFNYSSTITLKPNWITEIVF